MKKKSAELIITTHKNADLDAIASMVAAARLYPDAVLINPSMQVRSHSNEFIKNISSRFQLQSVKDYDLSSVKTLVVVDTRQRSRISHVEAVLNNPNLIVHLYDHHPDSDDDINTIESPNFSIVKQYGSCTAILVELMLEKNINISPDEATMLGLGIYEDTGSFKFNSTSEHDLKAAAWLRQQGMDLNVIQDADSDNLNSQQVNALNLMLQAAEVHRFKGVAIVITDCVLESYLGDISSLVQKMLEMEKFKVLFAIAQMADKIQIIGRSSLSSVNVGAICKKLGGGGHSYAAAASLSLATNETKTPTTVKGIADAKDKLLTAIISAVKPKITVRSLMSAPVLSLNIEDNLNFAEKFMSRYGLKAAPVIDYKTNPLKAVGLIEYQTAIQAKAHQLGDLKVQEYMKRNLLSVNPDDELKKAQRIIMNHSQRLIPVVLKDEMVGVITRTDVLRALSQNDSDETEYLEVQPSNEQNKTVNLATNIRERLPKSVVALLETAGNLADELSYNAYAVGGFVRDLLMGTASDDLDICVEGNGILFAQKLAEKLNGTLKIHEAFKTAVVVYPDPSSDAPNKTSKVDIATSRLEYYESPGALPNVAHSSIRMDLYRRDFTVNALALELNKANFGNILDFYGAQRDIKNKVIRVIHSLSFIEDPTRILRAIRFEVRFGFKLGVQAERLIVSAIGLDMINKISGHRLFDGFNKICNEKHKLTCFKRMESFKLLQAIHPILQLSPSKEELMVELEKIYDAYSMVNLNSHIEAWEIYLLGLCSGAKYLEVAELLKRLSFSEKAIKKFIRVREQCKNMQHKIRELKEEYPAQLTSNSTEDDEDKSTEKKVWNIPMSLLAELLHPLPIEGLMLLIASEPDLSLRKTLAYYAAKVREEEIEVTGKDLLKMGLKPSAVVSNTLNTILKNKIDGFVKSKDEQLALAQQLVDAHLKNI